MPRMAELSRPNPITHAQAEAPRGRGGAGARAAHRVRGYGLVLGLLLVCAAGRVAAEVARAPQRDIPLEYAVKATYLYKLAPFVNWPPEEFSSPAAPFRICIVGRNPFGDFLHGAVAGRSLGTHRFEVQTLDTLHPGSDCQVAFIDDPQPERVRAALDAVVNEPVLTVTEADAPAGIVQFVLHRGRVRFRIDAEAAARHRISISSKLLDLALGVKEGT